MPSGPFALPRFAEAVWRCRSAPSFKLSLPPEVWLIIFCLVVESTAVPYNCYSADTFHFCRNGQDLSAMNDGWRRISLVCRKWASMAGTRPFVDASSGNYQLNVGVRGIACSYPSPQNDSVINNLTRSPEVTSHLTTLAITQMRYTRDEGIVGLLDNSSSFPMLRSLRIRFGTVNMTEVVPHFWRRLAAGFPKLISLDVYNCPPPPRDNPVVFPRLEILSITGYIHSCTGNPILRVPRIKHCEIRALHADPRQLLMADGHQLESFAFDGIPTIDDLWTLFPNLLTLETSITAVGRLRWPPPPGHPIRRMILVQQGHHAVDEATLRGFFLRFPTVKHWTVAKFYLTPQQLRSLQQLVEGHQMEFSAHQVHTWPPPWIQPLGRFGRVWSFVCELPFMAFIVLWIATEGIACVLESITPWVTFRRWRWPHRRGRYFSWKIE